MGDPYGEAVIDRLRKINLYNDAYRTILVPAEVLTQTVGEALARAQVPRPAPPSAHKEATV